MANHFDLHAALTLAAKPGPFVTMTLPITGVPVIDRTQFNSQVSIFFRPKKSGLAKYFLFPILLSQYC